MSNAGKSNLFIEAVYGFGMVLGIQVSVDIERRHGRFVPHLPLHGLHGLPSGNHQGRTGVPDAVQSPSRDVQYLQHTVEAPADHV